MRPLSQETTPPGDRRELLAATDSRGRALYGLVRQFVDELEDAAPWTLLDTPPTASADHLARIARVLELIQEAPLRIAQELNDLTSSGTRFGREARDEAEFYFGTLHQMTAPSRRLLAAALARAALDPAPSRSSLDEISALAADLKAEFSSAMMGAAAALVSDGRWLGVEVETILFPEKAEERLRNRRLLQALSDATQTLAAVRTGFPWQPLLESWRARRPAERYALSVLLAVRQHLLTLLSAANRRALFSGDHRLLERREIPLGSRLRELEELHLSSLDLATGPPAESAGSIFDRLVQLLLEVAALLDIETLRVLVGGDEIRRLRAQVAHSGPSSATGTSSNSLALLVGEEDLTMFLQLLHDSVGKRLSIALDRGVTAPPKPPVRQPDASPAPLADPPGTIDPLGLARRGRNGIHDRLEAVLSRLLHSAQEPWRAFQMVHKLQTRLRILPPTLTAEILPFLGLLRTDLLPVLDAAVAGGVLPATAAEVLRSCDRNLSGRDLSHPGISHEVSDDMGRIVRLLQSLEAALAARRERTSPQDASASKPVP